MRSICLVSCVSKKRGGLLPAKDLYCSPWFISARRYAETFDDWRILSAKHGLLMPGDIVCPYDETMADKTKQEREIWSRSIVAELTQEKHITNIVILAGKKYREFIVPALKNLGYSVDVPMRGLGIGQQLAWLKSVDERQSNE